MKKIIMLAMALMTMLVSLGGCYWPYPGHDRGDRHDRSDRHDRDGRYDRDGRHYYSR